MNKNAKWLATGAGVAGAAYATYVTSAWLGYGRPKGARGADGDVALDGFMPTYDGQDPVERPSGSSSR
jgi:hypothetical protein